MVQLALLIVRFGKFPNYLTVHDWPANVWRIIRSNPAIADMIPSAIVWLGLDAPHAMNGSAVDVFGA